MAVKSSPLVSDTVRALVTRAVIEAKDRPRGLREKDLLVSGQVGLLHTRRTRERNGQAALVKAVGRKGVVFRVATRSVTAPLFEDLFVSWKRFDFVFVPVPDEVPEGGESLLILRLLGFGTRLADKVRCDVSDPYDVRLVRRFMCVASARAKAYLADTLDQEAFATVVPGFDAGNSVSSRLMKAALYEMGRGKAAKKRVRALLEALLRRGCFQQAYDTWLLNPRHVSFKWAKRLMRTFAADLQTYALCEWNTKPGFAVHWTAALLDELVRRHLAVAKRGGIRGFSGLVVRLLRDGGVTREEWFTRFPNARKIARALGCGRAKFWRVYMGS